MRQYCWKYDKFASESRNIPRGIAPRDILSCSARGGQGGANTPRPNFVLPPVSPPPPPSLSEIKKKMEILLCKVVKTDDILRVFPLWSGQPVTLRVPPPPKNVLSSICPHPPKILCCCANGYSDVQRQNVWFFHNVHEKMMQSRLSLTKMNAISKLGYSAKTISYLQFIFTVFDTLYVRRNWFLSKFCCVSKVVLHKIWCGHVLILVLELWLLCLFGDIKI